MGEPADPGPRSGVRRTDTKDPKRSRERALKVLFQADVRGMGPQQVLDSLTEDADGRFLLDDVDDFATGDDAGPSGSRTSSASPARAGAGASSLIDGFTRSLVLGVADHLDEIDQLISRYARRWQISRMPAVDRTVLRLATYELLHEPTPAAVVIDQAVGLAKALSTDDSGRYVNGVLESIRKDLAARGPR